MDWWPMDGMSPGDGDLPQVEHVPGTKPRPKMDTPTGLFAGICSCGWISSGIESQSGALKSATQHANAKNEE